MQRMGIVGAVAEDQPIARPCLQHEFLLVRIGLAVDRGQVELAGAAREFFRTPCSMVCSGAAGAPLRPHGRRACNPRRLPGCGTHCGCAMLVGVLDHDAEAGLADGVIGRAQDPDAGLVHFDVGVDALAGAERQHLDGLRRGHRVAIERQHLELVTGQGDACGSRCALALSRCISTRCPAARGSARRRRAPCR